METIKSKSGFNINVCCASCTHKQLDDRHCTIQAKRVCEVTGEQVAARMFCDKCEVRQGLLNL